uniref:Uncharacterized protein n=1 Tax=Ditylenchus dipsaci TaxID=166011 RepID=A0A915CPZ2_9BILA
MLKHGRDLQKYGNGRINIGTYHRISGGSYIIPFEISSEISHAASQLIERAMAEIAHGQCIEFRDIAKATDKATEKKGSYLSFTESDE